MERNMIENIPLKKVLILGFGVSGRAAARFLLKRGVEVAAVDRQAEHIKRTSSDLSLVQDRFQLFSELDDLILESFNLLVLSPGISLQHPLCIRAHHLKIPIVGEIELAFRYLKNPVLAITGTNGKTTTTLMTTHILNHHGFAAVALGNIGKPLIEELEQLNRETIVVLELSSFQIETLATAAIDRAVLLNITPDHLDRYKDLEDYACAKIRLQRFLKEGGVLICEKQAFDQYLPFFSGKQNILTYGYDPDCDFRLNQDKLICSKGSYQLPGSASEKNHDFENLTAVWALCEPYAISWDSFLDCLKTFQKPPHRLEFVREVDGVSFYDDSKGTNLDAVIRAVDFFKRPVILIAGGVHKGASYKPWIDGFSGKVKCVCAIGLAAPLIAEDLKGSIPTFCFETLNEAVTHAKGIAENGQVVLLSPGCSSYDMFKDYAHRGQEFQRIVNSLSYVET